MFSLGRRLGAIRTPMRGVRRSTRRRRPMHSFCDERGGFVRVCVVHAGRAGRGAKPEPQTIVAWRLRSRGEVSTWTADSTVRHQRRYADRVYPSTTRLVNVTMNFCVANGKSPVLRSAGASNRGGFLYSIHSETDDSRDFFCSLFCWVRNPKSADVARPTQRCSSISALPPRARPSSIKSAGQIGLPPRPDFYSGSCTPSGHSTRPNQSGFPPSAPGRDSALGCTGVRAVKCARGRGSVCPGTRRRRTSIN